MNNLGKNNNQEVSQEILENTLGFVEANLPKGFKPIWIDPRIGIGSIKGFTGNEDLYSGIEKYTDGDLEKIRKVFLNGDNKKAVFNGKTVIGLELKYLGFILGIKVEELGLKFIGKNKKEVLVNGEKIKRVIGKEGILLKVELESGIITFIDYEGKEFLVNGERCKKVIEKVSSFLHVELESGAITWADKDGKEILLNGEKIKRVISKEGSLLKVELESGVITWTDKDGKEILLNGEKIKRVISKEGSLLKVELESGVITYLDLNNYREVLLSNGERPGELLRLDKKLGILEFRDKTSGKSYFFRTDDFKEIIIKGKRVEGYKTESVLYESSFDMIIYDLGDGVYTYFTENGNEIFIDGKELSGVKKNFNGYILNFTDGNQAWIEEEAFTELVRLEANKVSQKTIKEVIGTTEKAKEILD